MEIGAVSFDPRPSTARARSSPRPPKQILLHSAKFPLDCRHRGRTRGKQGGQRRSEEEQGSSCTNGFSIRQKLLQALQEGSQHVQLLGEKKGSMPHNLSGTLLSEGRPRPSQSVDIIVTYFYIQFVYCVYFFGNTRNSILSEEKN